MTLSTDGRVDGFSQLERQEWIAERVQQTTFVSTKELSERFDVSIMTIHRDLDQLELRGVLRKVHGGATPLPFSLQASSVRSRLKAAGAAKEALAKFALGLIAVDQTVMLDDSTTILALARQLPILAPLTVITNFHAVLHELNSARDIRLILLGGEYDPQRDAFGGLVCEAAIGALQADVVFMSTAAVTGGGAYERDQQEALVKRAMLNIATRRVLLVDHSKVGATALHRLAPLRTFDLIVVDADVDETKLGILRDAGASVAIAPLA